MSSTGRVERRAMRIGWLLAASWGLWIHGMPAAVAAEFRTTEPAISLYANYETVSVYGGYIGDANDDGTARFEYKEATASTWLPGMAMHKLVEEQRFAAFFFAQPDVTYEVKITLTDPDGVTGTNPVQATATTRNDQVPVGSGATYHVSPAGRDANPGTEASPFRNVYKAASVVGAGDTVFVHPGTYRGSATLIGKAGTASDWITFEAVGDGPVILDGSNPKLLPTGQNRWSVYSGSVYQTPLSSRPAKYLAIDGLRAYHYRSLPDLLAGFEGVPAGWFYSGGTLYVRTKDGSDPDQHVIQAAKKRYGFELGDSHYLKIKGFTIRYYGEAAIRLNGMETNIVIEDNTIQNNRFGIRKGGRGGSRLTIQRNTITDTEVFTWPWNKVKKTEHEAAGVQLFAMDQGAVVRDNTVSGYFDGISISFWPPALGYNFDSDVSNNTIEDCGDDGIQFEGSNQTNIRFWENRLNRCFVAMSVNPVLRGPVYLVRNTVFETISEGFKVGSAGATSSGFESVGAVEAYHNTIHAIDDAGNDDDGVQCTNGLSYQNHTYRNNVFYVGRYVVTNEGCQSTGTTYDYDLMYTKDPSRFVKWDNKVRYGSLAEFQQATGQALHAIDEAPQFEDITAGDLRLTATSPGVDAGTILVGFNDATSPWPYTGSLPDLGAVEVGGAQLANQPPVLATIGNRVVNIGESVTVPVSASDPDGDALTYSVSSAPAGSTFTGQTLSWTPTADQAGIYQVTFSVSDGASTDSETITITVQDSVVANQPPVLAPIGDQVVDEGGILGFVVSATDPDVGDVLTLSATDLPSGAGFTDDGNGTGTFTWIPAVDQAGRHTVTFTVSDGVLADSQVITITVLSAQAAAQAFQEAGGQVVIEAESFVDNIPRKGKNWVLETAVAGYAGTGYLHALENTRENRKTEYVTESPELVYHVQFTTPGTYYVWVRGYGETSGDNSIHAGIDGTGPSSADNIDGFPASWTWNRSTRDGVVATLEVPSPGLHTLHLWMREDGFRVDRFLLRTDSSESAPAGVGPAESPRGSGNPDATPPVTTANPPGGTYSAPVDVTLSANELATLYYTMDGTTPTTASPVYAGPILISGTTLQFFGVDLAGNPEAVRSELYVISEPSPDATPPSTPVVTDDGEVTASTTDLYATWTAATDPESGIAAYHYQVRQDDAAGLLLRDWTPVGLATEVTATGLSLLDGTTYVLGVRALNDEGLASAAGFSDGIVVDAQPPQLSALEVTDLTTATATVHWLSDEPATSEVEYGLTTSYGQSTPVEPALVTAHTVGLAGLSPGTLYHYRVRSIDAVGNEAASSDATFTTLEATGVLAFQESGGQVVIEAESFVDNIPRREKTWVLETDVAGYAGTSYLHALENTGKNRKRGYVTRSPELVYHVQFTTPGTYYVWVRGYGETSKDDSIHAGIDGTGPASADKIDGFPASWTWSRNTRDGVVATLEVPNPGLHTIHLWMREDGFRVDRFLLRTNSSGTAPSGIGPAESPTSSP